MCICVCMCVYMYVHVCMCVYVYMRVHVHVYICMYVTPRHRNVLLFLPEDSDEESAVVRITKRNRKGGLVERVSQPLVLGN